MANWGGALEVGGLPSSASIDELSVLLSQLAHCRQHHILLSSRGAASAVAALVLLPSADEASSVADMLDSYPLSGGLLETRPCADAADWVRRHVLQHLPKVGSRRQQAPPPAQPVQPPAPQPLRPPQPMQPPAPQPMQPPPPQPLPSTTTGLTALEAEAREVQRMLQEQQQLFGSGGSGGGGWDAEEEGGASDSEGDWSHVGGRSGGARSAAGGKGQPKRSSSGAVSNCRLVVRNIAQEVHPTAVRSFFSQFGQLTDAIKFPEARYAFVHFFNADDAAAALAAVHGQVVPELNPSVPVHASYRDQSSGGSGASGGSKAGAAPRKASGSGGGHPISANPTGKLFVGHIEGGVTVQDLEAVFGRFGPVYDLELRRANGEGRSDQWAFVNFRRKQDALAAYEQLEGEYVPELTGNRPLKLQFRSA